MHVVDHVNSRRGRILSYLLVDENIILSLIYRSVNSFFFFLSYSVEISHGRIIQQDAKTSSPSINASAPFEKVSLKQNHHNEIRQLQLIFELCSFLTQILCYRNLSRPQYQNLIVPRYATSTMPVISLWHMHVVYVPLSIMIFWLYVQAFTGSIVEHTQNLDKSSAGTNTTSLQVLWLRIFVSIQQISCMFTA